MQLKLNIRSGKSGRWIVYCSPAGGTEPQIGDDRTFATLEDLATALDGAGVPNSRYGPTIRAAKDGYESGFLVSPAEAQRLELLDDDEATRQSTPGQGYRRVR